MPQASETHKKDNVTWVEWKFVASVQKRLGCLTKEFVVALNIKWHSIGWSNYLQFTTLSVLHWKAIFRLKILVVSWPGTNFDKFLTIISIRFSIQSCSSPRLFSQMKRLRPVKRQMLFIWTHRICWSVFKRTQF